MEIKEWVVLIVLIGNGIQDLRKKEIYLLPTVLAGIMGIVWQLAWRKTTVWFLLLGCVPGIFMLGVGRATQGKLGLGDGVIVLTMGIWLGMYETWFLLAAGLLMASAAGAVWMLRKSHKKEMAFVPFLLMAYTAGRILK